MEVKCNLIESNKPTVNNRVYRKETMEKVVRLFKENQDEMFGELQEGGKTYYPEYVDLQNISHKVKDLDIEHGKFSAQIEMLDTESGKKAVNEIGLGNLELFPRFIGKMNENDEVDIENIVSFDLLYKRS